MQAQLHGGADVGHDVFMGHIEQPLELRQNEVDRLQDVDAIRRAHGFDNIEDLVLGFVGKAVERFLWRGEDAAAIDAAAG